MTCHDVQLHLSLYLYGELEFAQEEALEEHVGQCAFCQRSLAREKAWHTDLNAGQLDAPFDLLSDCRQTLRSTLTAEPSSRRWHWRWPAALTVSPTRWSSQLALGSFLVFVGFTSARLADRFKLPGSSSPLTISGLVNPVTTRVRDIQPSGQDQVRILLNQESQREIVGSPNDPNVKGWLLIGAKDSNDPSIRVDSFEYLKGQSGTDVRDALLNSAEHDSNAAVRLKALESVRPFAGDPATLAALKYVLEHDGDPAVRSKAIDLLAPLNQQPKFGPDVTSFLQTLARSGQDDYVRTRSLELLRQLNAPLDVY